MSFASLERKKQGPKRKRPERHERAAAKFLDDVYQPRLRRLLAVLGDDATQRRLIEAGLLDRTHT